VEIMLFLHFYMQFGIINTLLFISQLEPHFTTSAREFAVVTKKKARIRRLTVLYYL